MSRATMEINNARILSTTTGTKIVTELPVVGEDGIIYMIIRQNSTQGWKYNKFMWIDYSWENLSLPDQIVEDLSNKLDTEITERKTNQGNLNNLTTSSKDCLVSAINEVNSNLAAEVVIRRSSDETLQTSIDNEVTRASQAETVETNRARQAEGDLLILVETQRSRIQAVESKIPNQATSDNKLADQAFVNTQVSAKQDKLTAGPNITIENNVISAAQSSVPIVNFTFNTSSYQVSADKTPQQVKYLMLTSPVIATIKFSSAEDVLPLGSFSANINSGSVTVDKVTVGFIGSTSAVIGDISTNSWSINLS